LAGGGDEGAHAAPTDALPAQGNYKRTARPDAQIIINIKGLFDEPKAAFFDLDEFKNGI